MSRPIFSIGSLEDVCSYLSRRWVWHLLSHSSRCYPSSINFELKFCRVCLVHNGRSLVSPVIMFIAVISYIFNFPVCKPLIRQNGLTLCRLHKFYILPFYLMWIIVRWAVLTLAFTFDWLSCVLEDGGHCICHVQKNFFIACSFEYGTVLPAHPQLCQLWCLV